MKYVTELLAGRGSGHKARIVSEGLQHSLRRSSHTSTLPQIKYKKPLVSVTLEPRDKVQSGIKGIPEMGPGSDMMEYFHVSDQINHVTDGGQPWIKSIVGYGGTWWQLLAMHNIHPHDHLRNVAKATPLGTPIECLQRASHGFALEECSQEVLEETYRSVARIMGKDRPLPIRLFQFNNNKFQKDTTYAAIETLLKEGAGQFVISDEHSYSSFMEIESVAQGVVAGLKRGLPLAKLFPDTYPLQGGIKDFIGDMLPETAQKVLIRTHALIAEEAEVLERSGDILGAALLRSSIITMHNHLTDRTQDTAQAWIETAVSLSQPITIHGIHDVENATHPTLQRHILPHMKKAGIIVSSEQDMLNERASASLARLLEKHRSSVIMDYTVGVPRAATGFAGGGKPMILQYVSNIAAFKKIPMEEAEKLLHDEMAIIRDKNKIPPVTPAQKAIADLALMRIQNKGRKGSPYEGAFSPEAIDVVRNLRPEQAEEKDLLENGWRQYREQTLKAKVAEGAISKETVEALAKVGMNADKSSLDKEQTLAILKAATVNGKPINEEIIDDIVEASGPATRPTKLHGQMERASAVVATLEEKGELKLPKDEATVVVASLWGRGIGETLVKHFGDPTKFPALAASLVPPSYEPDPIRLMTANIAGSIAWKPIPLIADAALVELVGEENLQALIDTEVRAAELRTKLADKTRSFGPMKERLAAELEESKSQISELKEQARTALTVGIKADVKSGTIELEDANDALVSDMHQLDAFVSKGVQSALKEKARQAVVTI